MLLGYGFMKNWLAVFIIAMCLPLSAKAEEEKGFWASLVPDNSSALTIMEDGKAFFAQLFEDGKDTGKVIIEGGKNIVTGTGDVIKSIISSDE